MRVEFFHNKSNPVKLFCNLKSQLTAKIYTASAEGFLNWDSFTRGIFLHGECDFLRELMEALRKLMEVLCWTIQKVMGGEGGGGVKQKLKSCTCKKPNPIPTPPHHFSHGLSLTRWIVTYWGLGGKRSCGCYGNESIMKIVYYSVKMYRLRFRFNLGFFFSFV